MSNLTTGCWIKEEEYIRSLSEKFERHRIGHQVSFNLLKPRGYLGAGVVGEGDERDENGDRRGDEDDARDSAARIAAAAAILVRGAVGAAAQRRQPPHDACRVVHRAGQQIAPRQRLEARLKRLVPLLTKQHKRPEARHVTLLTEQAQILD